MPMQVPWELLCTIVVFLEFPDCAVAAARVCRQWRRAALETLVSLRWLLARELRRRRVARVRSGWRLLQVWKDPCAGDSVIGVSSAPTETPLRDAGVQWARVLAGAGGGVGELQADPLASPRPLRRWSECLEVAEHSSLWTRSLGDEHLSDLPVPGDSGVRHVCYHRGDRSWDLPVRAVRGGCCLSSDPEDSTIAVVDIEDGRVAVHLLKPPQPQAPAGEPVSVVHTRVMPQGWGSGATDAVVHLSEERVVVMAGVDGASFSRRHPSGPVFVSRITTDMSVSATGFCQDGDALLSAHRTGPLSARERHANCYSRWSPALAGGWAPVHEPASASASAPAAAAPKDAVRAGTPPVQPPEVCECPLAWRQPRVLAPPWQPAAFRPSTDNEDAWSRHGSPTLLFDVLCVSRPSCEGITGDGNIVAMQFFRYSPEERSREIRIVCARTGCVLVSQKMAHGWDKAFTLCGGLLVAATGRDVFTYSPVVPVGPYDRCSLPAHFNPGHDDDL
eukprot:TRINITY_DN3074_c3_g2_i1.p1 TRINITY_DN3074_c3_g2~~TRINITY_DN3074_c3_g2_i1.p1  ORF type:complete len:504 (+),score=129.98 TRINITY_DN3074_c3_g2_i1:77-1588(+)